MDIGSQKGANTMFNVLHGKRLIVMCPNLKFRDLLHVMYCIIHTSRDSQC